MKYLVNRETKEHVRFYDMPGDFYFHDHWQVVEADSEGWIPWSGGGCPLPDDTLCEVYFDGRSHETNRPNCLRWSSEEILKGGNITKYRPILTEQSEPEKGDGFRVFTNIYEDETIFADVTVFDRLRTAAAHAASIPSIIAEIDELLGPDYQVVRVEKIEAQPVDDMSDWRNWKPGDFIIHKGETDQYFTKGKLYKIKIVHRDDGVRVVDDEGYGHDLLQALGDFRFHSRPTGATK